MKHRAQAARTPQQAAEWLAAQAREVGFDLCGVTPVDGLEELAHLPGWLSRGYGGEMRYLHDPRRLSPARVLAGARSVVVCGLNYNTPHPYSTQVPRTSDEEPRGWVSRYAWGEDYHNVLGKKLDELLERMRTEFAEPFEARAYVDTGPIVERVAARHAGLGWLAKNTCLINPELGSWLFLGVIVTTLELAPSLGPAQSPPPDLCGNCTLCIEACPTGAIVEPYVLDARRCISYLTIELRGSIPEELRAPMGRHVFGCDICQDICPWNRQAPVSNEPRFLPCEAGASEKESERHSLFNPLLAWLVSLTEDDFRSLSRQSAIKRATWRGLVRNTCVAFGNSGLARDQAPESYARAVGLLECLAASPDPIIADHARWALGRLTSEV